VYIPESFLGNGSVNMFPQQPNRRAIIEVLLEMGVSTRSVSRGYKEDNLSDRVSSVLESVKRRLEHVKLNNLHY
jgi:hypothetical protein